MNTANEKLMKLVQDNNSDVYFLSSEMIELETVQGAVARLIERIDEITHNGWDRDSGMAFLSIKEIQDTVRLIDLAFQPLFGKIKDIVGKIDGYSDDLYYLARNTHLASLDVDTQAFIEKNGREPHNSYELMIWKNKQLKAAGKVVIDTTTAEGWNYCAMDSNIKLFTKEVGRDPESFEEVQRYIMDRTQKIIAECEAKKQEEKADAPTSTNEI